MKTLVPTFIAVTFALLVGSASAQSDAATVQRATDGMIRLRSMMKDPNSFVLETAYLLNPDKHGISEICYLFNSHNSFGGYGETGEAFLNKKDGVYVVDEDLRKNPFYAMTDSCRPKNRVADLIAAENASFKKEGVAGYAEVGQLRAAGLRECVPQGSLPCSIYLRTVELPADGLLFGRHTGQRRTTARAQSEADRYHLLGVELHSGEN